MVDKNKTQNKLGDPKRVIKICLFLSMPKGPPAPWLRRSALSGLIFTESLTDEPAHAFGAFYCRWRRALVWE